MKNNKKIAIDIVLLLSDEMNKMACELSAKIIPSKDFKEYVLDNLNYFPHISLLMGTAKENEITSIRENILPILKKYLPLTVTFTKVELSANRFPYLVIKKTKKLASLQSEITKIIKVDYDATKKMCADSDISDQGIDFINNFRENNLGQGKFKLHLTLGFGDASFLNINFPIKTIVDTIAIGHIGYGCSFRKLLTKIT